MRGNPDKIKGKGFDVNPQNINRSGANRNSIAAVNVELEANGYHAASKKDIIDCYLRLVNIDLPELTEMVNGSKNPALVRVVGKGILSGKGFDIIERMLDRAIHKPTQKIENENTNKQITQITYIDAIGDSDT